MNVDDKLVREALGILHPVTTCERCDALAKRVEALETLVLRGGQCSMWEWANTVRVLLWAEAGRIAERRAGRAKS